ncbi:MAG: hypothetical protein QXG04_00290 [Sulfolobales archaeon]
MLNRIYWYLMQFAVGYWFAYRCEDLRRQPYNESVEWCLLCMHS